MKVIQIIPNLCMGGAEIMCETLTQELVQNGVDVKVISLYRYETPITKRLSRAGVSIEYLDKKPGMDLSILKKLRRIFEQEKPDAVHSHLNAQKYAMLAAKQAGVSVRIHTVHSVADKEYGRIETKLAEHFYKKQGVIPVALSDRIRETVIQVYGLSPNRIPVIHNGINLTKCIKKNDYSIRDTVEILHIGRFSPEKNHKGLIEAFKIFHEAKPNSHLSLIGDGSTLEAVKQQVEDCALTNAVTFHGLQTEVYPYIAAADIFVLPSLYEGIPMTLIEAMGTGIPIVASNVGGIPNMLTNEESALLTPVDGEAIAHALMRLSEDENLRRTLGQSALACSEAFSSEAMARQYIELYQGGVK